MSLHLEGADWLLEVPWEWFPRENRAEGLLSCVHFQHLVIGWHLTQSLTLFPGLGRHDLKPSCAAFCRVPVGCGGAPSIWHQGFQGSLGSGADLKCLKSLWFLRITDNSLWDLLSECLITRDESWLLLDPIFGSHFPISLNVPGMPNSDIYVLVVLCMKFWKGKNKLACCSELIPINRSSSGCECQMVVHLLLR